MEKGQKINTLLEEKAKAWNGPDPWVGQIYVRMLYPPRKFFIATYILLKS